ncbi:UNVERIFIED_CONTAM: hypothetical protein PYX00_004665 [Menopon gallinae]|uniref:Uncharacterized protein n=1 Tax=Menopon gallinae TaxID=328185 RepID=A0AAW2I6B0_9NEOP
MKTFRTPSKKSASDDLGYSTQSNGRKSSPVFTSYEEELEHRLEHDPSPTESELLRELEYDFDDDDEERTAGSVRQVPEQEQAEEKQQFLRCSQPGSGLRRSYEGQIDTSESEDYIGVRTRKKISETRRKEKRKTKREKKSDGKTKTVKNEVVDYTCLSVCKVLEESTANESEKPVDEVKENVSKPATKCPPPVPQRRSILSRDAKQHKSVVTIPVQESPEENRFKTEVSLPIVESEEEKSKVDESDRSHADDERSKSESGPSKKKGDAKGLLQQLYEEGLKEIHKKQTSESESEERQFPELKIISENPFKEEIKLGQGNYVAKRPQSLKIKVGFESPAIGQELTTPPTLADTEEKTLPYYLKSQNPKLTEKERKSVPPSTERCENNIEYEKYVELGKNLIKVQPTEKNSTKEKKLQEAEVDRRIIAEEIQKSEERRNSLPRSPKKSLKKLDIKRVKEPKPDYSNEIREEVDPITPDTDQSEIEEILETFSRELQNSDVNEILSGDESRAKWRSPPPTAVRETAFLSSPVVTCNSMSQPEKPPLRKTVSVPRNVSKAREQVLKTSMLRKEGRPNSLSLANNNGLPDTSLTLENYLDRKRMQYPQSGRVSAPLFKENHSPGYLSGRSSVPVDFRSVTPDRGRPVMRTPVRSRYSDYSDENFKRNNPRTRSLTRDAYRCYPETRTMVQNNVIYESKIPRANNREVPARKPDGYSANEIEAMFWERLKQKKMQEALREKQLTMEGKAENGFVRNAPNRSSVGPIYQNAERESVRPRPQSAMDFTQDSDRSTGADGKKKGLISKIPFFRRKSKGSKEDSYKRASEEYEDNYNTGSVTSTSSIDTPDTNMKKVSFDKTDNAAWPARNGQAQTPPARMTRPLEKQSSSDSDVFFPVKKTPETRPLPPLPRDGGYGVISRRVQSPEYGRIAVAETHRASPLYEFARKEASPARNMGIIHENELYANGKQEVYAGPRPLLPKAQTHSDTESGSEAGEVQRILHGADRRPTQKGESFFIIIPHTPSEVISNEACPN